LLTVPLALWPGGPPARGQDIMVTPEAASAERAVYDNPVLFEQLSGAARTRAEMKFGRRVPGGVKPVVGDPGAGRPGPRPRTLLANPLVNDPTEDTTTQDTQSETTLVLAGTNVACAFNDSSLYNSGASAYYFTGWSHSSNGGTNWTDHGHLPNSYPPNGDAGDPVLAYSQLTGTLILSTLSFNGYSNLNIFRSTDKGATFTGPVNGAPGFNSTTGDHDKEWVACDNFPGTGYGTFYMFWRNFGSPGGMTLTKSTDDGVTWGPAGGTVLLSGNGGQGAQVVVGPDHSVYCFWHDSTTTPYRIVMRKSTDYGATFGATVTIATLIGTGVNGDLGLGGFRSSSFCQAVVNPVSGNVYVIYPDATAVSGGDRGNIFFQQSTDGGATWSAAYMVNDDGTTRAQFQPGIAVRPDGTGLSVCWYDRRNDPADAMIERWGVTAAISGATLTWGLNFRISQPFPAVYGVDSVVNSVYMGDYDQLAADNNFFYTTWGDNRDNSTASPGRKNANVRFARFPMGGPGPVLGSGTVTIVDGNGNGYVDPNECVQVTVGLNNSGTALAANVAATITTPTPGVTLIQSSSAYPDIAVGGSANNTAPFQIQTSPAFVCGTPIELDLAISYTGGGDSSTVFLPVASPGYVITQTTGASIVPGVTDSGNHADDGTTTINLPFAFTLYGQNYVTATLSSNGNVEFGSNSSAYSNVCLPVAGFADTIFAHWDDLRTDGVGHGIYLSTSGVAPNRIFNIEWRAQYFSPSNDLNFEVRLYEGQSRFDVIYGAVPQGGSSATVGVQHDGTTATSFECNVGGLSPGLQLTFQTQMCSDGGGPCVPGAPYITTQPTNQSVAPGGTATFSVVAGGVAPLSYFWRRNGTPIDGATTTSYTTNNVQPGDSGALFSCLVSNANGTALSASAVLTVGQPPAINAQPANQTVAAGNLATFSVGATGSAPLGYFWERNGGFIAGATTSAYSFTTQVGDSGAQFSCLVSNAFGSALSSNALLTVTGQPPVIVTQPANQSAAVGNTATFRVTATGTAPLSYFWRRNGGVVAGATSSAYSFTASMLDGGVQFSCLVSNGSGSALSSNAVLTITPASGGNAVAYLRTTNGLPWGSADNEAILNLVFGPGWQDLRYETANPAAVFTATNRFIILEGGADGGPAMGTFLTNNLPAISNWVAGGGSLFVDAAPFFGGGGSSNYYLGFGVTLAVGDVSSTATAANPAHAIFTGPNLPVGTSWAGNYFAHSSVSGLGLTGLITNNANGNLVLAERGYGLGHLMFGGMTLPLFHTPQPQATNLLGNIFVYGVSQSATSNLVVAAFDTGWYDSTGTHNPANANYIAGWYHSGGDIGYHDWFAFNVPVLPGALATASLVVNAYNVVAPLGTLGYELRDVSTPVATLVAGGSGLTNIYNDLGDGVIYGTRTFSTNESNLSVTIPLNSAAVAALSAAQGQAFAFGGQVNNLLGTTNDQYIFGASLGVTNDVRLVLGVAVGPVTPAIATQPASQVISAGGPVTFCVSATGTAPLSYFWRRNGSVIAGATNSCYTTNSVQVTDSGAQFSCLVSNAFGTALSSNALLTVFGPTNDNCSGAIVITAYPYTNSQSTTNASSIGDPTPSCGSGFGRGVWYAYTPPTNGLLEVDTTGSDFDTVLALYIGSCGGLTQRACDDDSGGSLTSRIMISAAGGTTYYILAGGFGGAGGNLRLHLNLAPAPRILPPIRVPGSQVQFSFATAAGLAYWIEYQDEIGAGSWTPLQKIVGDGSLKTVTVPVGGVPHRYFRLRAE
jgi:hypothetical protein